MTSDIIIRTITAPLSVVNISPTFGELTAPFREILPIHKVTINSNNLDTEKSVKHNER
jgi:hypothetical protein